MVPLTKQRAASYYVAAKRQNFTEVREEKFLRKKTEHHFIFLLKEKMHDWKAAIFLHRKKFFTSFFILVSSIYMTVLSFAGLSFNFLNIK